VGRDDGGMSELVRAYVRDCVCGGEDVRAMRCLILTSEPAAHECEVK